MKADLLVVAAHPDDETLLAGGTIARRVREGHSVHVMTVAEGATSRVGYTQADVDRLASAFAAAARRLGVRETTALAYPDNRLDTVPLLVLAQRIEAIVADTEPTTVITHHLGDLNIDHRRVAEAALVACRPLPGRSVSEILAGEALSSTEWSLTPFVPVLFVQLTDDDATAKLEALGRYDGEIKPFPHARSIDAARVQMQSRGASVGAPWAEAFEILRAVR